MRCRQIQFERYRDGSKKTNGKIHPNDIHKYCSVSEEALQLLKEAFLKFNYSGRVYHRILKVSRTIADLENSVEIKLHHVAEALQYRPRVEEDAL